MHCQPCQELLDNLLVARPSKADHAGLVEHLDECAGCKREHALASRALASIQLSHKLRASPKLKERIMNAIAEVSVAEPKPRITPRTGTRLRKPALALGVAAAVLVAVVVFYQLIPGGNESGALSALGLFQQAAAAEQALFAGDDIVHIVNEIVVKPVSDPRWAQARWLPIISLEATGKPRFHQLTLDAEVGKGYTVEDHAWYDPATNRFARLLTVDGKPIFANSYDGKAIYWLETAGDGDLPVVRRPITKNFQAPKSPAEFLGIAAGLPSRLSEDDQGPAVDVAKAGEVTLDDGSEAHLLKLGYRREGPPGMPDAHFLLAIRKDNNTIAQIEFRAEEESLFVVRRVKTETVDRPAVPWNLAGTQRQVDEARPKPRAGILADMVIPNVSVEHMVEKADFETYLFSPDPPWTVSREIADILDIPSPPHRAFAVAYRAKDGRHVVLWQARSNTMLGEKLTKMGKVAYTSPAGTKVWSVPMEKWLAGILLQSARASIKDPPAESRTGYLLETPAGTFATLGINGQVTEAELHALADSLVPAKQGLPQGKP